jgi:ABC-type transport system involved in Fe-S cluster assembly fused permease/ATPase subunit
VLFAAATTVLRHLADNACNDGCEGPTLLVIEHRLCTVRAAGQIQVLDNGDITVPRSSAPA